MTTDFIIIIINAEIGVVTWVFGTYIIVYKLNNCTRYVPNIHVENLYHYKINKVLLSMLKSVYNFPRNSFNLDTCSERLKSIIFLY